MKCVYLHGNSQFVAGVKLNKGCNAVTDADVGKILGDEWGKRLLAANAITICVEPAPCVVHEVIDEAKVGTVEEQEPVSIFRKKKRGGKRK